MPVLSTVGAAAARGFGLTARGFFKFTATISSNYINYNLRAEAVAAGWNQITPLDAYVTINNGVTVYSASTSTPAFTTGTSYPSGSRLNLTNNGIILGRGGNGGNGGSPYPPPTASVAGFAGTAGGNALTTTIPVNLTNNNRIAGGGGGGGGGSSFAYPGGGTGGGGGGGGIGNGSGGNGVSGFGGGGTGSPGTAGTLTTAGTGGAIGSPSAGPGGNGGGYGTAGSTGGGAGGAGGAAGTSISGNSLVNYIVTGTINGPTV